MSYATIQAAVSTVIQKLTDYTSANVVEDDNRKLSAGVTKFVSLTRGESTREDIGMGGQTVLNTWEVIATLWIAFTTRRSVQASSVVTEMEVIIAELDKWPKLDNTSGVLDATVNNVGEPQEWVMGGRWWTQDVTVRVQEIVEVTLSE